MSPWSVDGFAAVPGIVGREEIDRIFAAITAQARKHWPHDPAFAGTRPWEKPAFDVAIAGWRDRDRMTFGRVYDSLQTNAAMIGTVSSPKIAMRAAEFLGEDVSGLSVGGVLFRIDTPGDARNRLDWHQERSYYPQNDDGSNGAVVWIALRDVGELDGTIMLRPGSHRKGFVQVAPSGGGEVSEQYRTPDEILAPYPAVSVAAEAGTAVFFHMHMFHASGLNRGARVRFTIGARFHKATADDFKPGRLIYTRT